VAPRNGRRARSLRAALLGPLSEAVIGRSSRDLEVLSAELERSVARHSSARSALDCALYDLADRTVGFPLFQYLGGAAPDVRTDVTLSAVTHATEVASLCRMALEFAEAGQRTLTMKVGPGMTT
jgi:L-alanine-DL-glutamate epimerase-like enolase superfamily enzyme